MSASISDGTMFSLPLHLHAEFNGVTSMFLSIRKSLPWLSQLINQHWVSE